jgi:DNA polymerase III alpha subunit
MWRTFAQLPAALQASSEIAQRCQFRLPLRRSKLAAERKEPLGPALLFGLEPARGVGEQQLTELVEKAVPARFAETGRGEPSLDVLERVRDELSTICGSDLADLLLFAHDVGRFCSERGIPLAARGSATSSLYSRLQQRTSHRGRSARRLRRPDCALSSNAPVLHPHP